MGAKIMAGLGTRWMRQNAEKAHLVRSKSGKPRRRKKGTPAKSERGTAWCRDWGHRQAQWTEREKAMSGRRWYENTAKIEAMGDTPHKKSKEDDRLRAVHLRYLVLRKLDKTRANEFGIIRRS